MNQNIKLIFTDLDDTLLRSDKTISQRTADVFSRCRQSGLLVGFATLRGWNAVSDYIDMLHPDVMICNGGSMIYHGENVIHIESFTLEQTRQLLSASYRLIGPNCEITLDTPEALYWNRLDDKSATYEVKCRYDDMRDFREAACKMCVQTADYETASQIASSAGDISYIPFSDIPWYKFSPKSATKENGVRILSEYLHISAAQIAAFGDDYSDLKMLQSVGYGIAVQNAIEPVKDAAAEVTLGCNDDGVADWIDKHLL